MNYAKVFLLLAFVLSTAILPNEALGQGACAIVERGPDYNVLQTTTMANGTNHILQYTELTTGLNYTNSSGQLVPSCEQITILPDGSAAATQGQHTVQFPADIYNGVLHVTTPDGLDLYSRPLCVCYDDGSNTVVIATVTNSVGSLTASNEITYTNCFAGITADLVCDYKRNGFDCSLVFRAQPPAPDQFGLDPSLVTLQLVTEFFNTEDPLEIPATSDEWYGLQDSTLKFGALTMTRGKAFAFNSTNTPPSSARLPTPVYKSWVHSSGRTFLVEQVPLEYVANNLEALPLSASIQKPSSSIRYLTSNRSVYPAGHNAVSDTNHILLAVANFKAEPGMVLDYIEINSDQSDYTFYSGQTYLIYGTVNLSGPTTIENGAVLKFNDDGCLIPDTDDLITFPEDVDNPAILTSVDDNSVGVSIGSGSPTTNNATYIAFQDNRSLTECPVSNVRISYAGEAIYADFEDGSVAITVSQSQFVNCTVALLTWGPIVRCENVLFGSCQTIIDGSFEHELDLQATHLTADQCGSVIVDFGPNSATVELTNSILSTVGDMISLPPPDSDSDYFTYPWLDASVTWQYSLAAGSIRHESLGNSNSCFYIDDAFGLYETAGNNNYYLAASSSYRDVGTTSIDSGLLAAIQTMTTYAPQDGGYPDNDGMPDLGYHYPSSGYIKNGLVAYWKLDDGSGSTAVDLIGGNNLTLHNSPAWGAGYLTFDGSTQYGDAGNPSALDITGPISICAWANSASFPTIGNAQVPVEKGYDGTTEGYFLRYYYCDYGGCEGLYLQDGTYVNPNVDGNLTTNLDSLSQWYFLTCTYDGTYWNLYVNGLLINKETATYAPQGNSVDLYVGAASISGSPARFFNGSIHDVGIYNRALNAGEVETNFINSKLNPVTTPDLLYLKMLEGATDTVTSASTILLNMADSSTIGHTNVILSYPYTREWLTNEASVPNSALHFNGTASYIDTHDTNNFNFTTNPFTVNFWALTLTGDKYLFSNEGFLNPRTTNEVMTNGWYIEVGGSESILFGSATPTSETYIASPNGVVSTALWNMVTCVWDGTNASIYIDGSLTTPVFDNYSAPASSDYSLVIGQEGSGVNFYDGDMWVPQIWSSALPAADIANLYIQQVKGIPWP